MKKIFLTCTIAAAMFATGCSGNGNSSGKDSTGVKTEKQTKSNEKKKDYEVTDGGLLSINGLPMLVDFSAEWCPPCRQLKPIFSDLKKEYKGKVDFVTINVDSMPELAAKYRIESIPALIYISRDGQELYRSVGFRQALEIKADISKYLN